MSFRFEDTRPTIASDAILEDLRRVAAELGGRALPQNQYRERGRFSHSLVKKRFGSWNGALEAAGLALDPSRRNIPDEELFDNLRAAWITLGRQPRRSEMAPPISQFGREPYVRRFGSWLGAMRSFVDAQAGSDRLFSEPPTDVRAKTRQPSVRLRFQVMKRDAFRCVACGRSPATHVGLTLHLDHILPFSKGGRTELSNLRTSQVVTDLSVTRNGFGGARGGVRPE